MLNVIFTKKGRIINKAGYYKSKNKLCGKIYGARDNNRCPILAQRTHYSNRFNGFNKRLQFVLKKEENKRICFLHKQYDGSTLISQRENVFNTIS